MAISLFDASSVSKESFLVLKLPFGYDAHRTAAFTQPISTVGLRHDAILRAHVTDRAGAFDLDQTPSRHQSAKPTKRTKSSFASRSERTAFAAKSSSG